MQQERCDPSVKVEEEDERDLSDYVVPFVGSVDIRGEALGSSSKDTSVLLVSEALEASMLVASTSTQALNPSKSSLSSSLEPVGVVFDDGLPTLDRDGLEMTQKPEPPLAENAVQRQQKQPSDSRRSSVILPRCDPVVTLSEDRPPQYAGSLEECIHGDESSRAQHPAIPTVTLQMRSTLCRFGREGWLNDEIINAYIAQVQWRTVRHAQHGGIRAHCYTTFFYSLLVQKADPEALLPWTTNVCTCV